MSYYVDPWLFNCTEQLCGLPRRPGRSRGPSSRPCSVRSDFARLRGVTLIAAGRQRVHGPRATRRSTTRARTSRRTRRTTRTIDNGCLSMPTRGAARPRRLVGGPGQPASSPYRARRSTPTTASSRRSSPHRAATAASSSGRPSTTRPRTGSSPPTRSTWPRACGEVDANGLPNGATLCDANTPGTSVPRSVPLVRNCADGVCALYQWIQGTSMASPHAVGVAALIVFAARASAIGPAAA